MEEIIPTISANMVEKVEPIEEPKKFIPRIFKARFEKVQAYKLPDDSRVHCSDGTKLDGHAGDYYVCLDNCVEFVLDLILFKRLFILHEKEQ